MSVAKDAGMTRHATLLRIKRASANGFTFTGWASTDDVDLVGDVVVPTGAVYDLPLPLLWQHDHSAPLGVVESANISGKGIRVTFRLLPEVAKTAEAVALIEAGALALSIGFIPLDDEPLPTGGRRFTRWRFYELSIVSVPANPSAKIDRVGKCLAYAQRSATPAPPSAPAIPAAWRSAVDARLRPGETELQRHYRQFDACVSLLPTDLRAVVDLRRSGAQKGVMHLIATDGQPIATVDLRTRSLRLASEPEPAPAPAPAVQATALAGDIKRRIARLEERALPFSSDEFAEVLGALVGGTMKPLLTRLALLEKAVELHDATMLAEIERRSWKHKGYWEQSQQYRLNDVVTDAGSAWLALCETKERPSFTATTWRVIAKKGRDA